MGMRRVVALVLCRKAEAIDQAEHTAEHSCIAAELVLAWLHAALGILCAPGLRTHGRAIIIEALFHTAVRAVKTWQFTFGV